MELDEFEIGTLYEVQQKFFCGVISFIKDFGWIANDVRSVDTGDRLIFYGWISDDDRMTFIQDISTIGNFLTIFLALDGTKLASFHRNSWGSGKTKYLKRAE